MPKIPLVGGFKDPVTRPRYIIWTGVAVLLLAVVVICALGATSTYWFCAEGCHKVQDDAIAAYDNSSHSRIACMACHMPVGADPITFVLHKMKALGELYLTVTDNYELPLNPHSFLSQSEEMTSKQCTQCHNLETRKVTPSGAVLIDHKAHEEAKPAKASALEHGNEIQCAWCHNRVAHNEGGNFAISLSNPKSKGGEKSVRHEDFMKMDACFRCHTLTDQSYSEQWKGPGECSVCHPKDFKLKPDNHEASDFYPKGHAEKAKEWKETNAEAKKVREELKAEKEEFPLASAEEVFYCGTCHVEAKFCMNCHGMEMPHSAEFKEKKHPEFAKTKIDKCDLCHDVKKTGFAFCNECHHGKKSNWKFDAKTPWVKQHFKAVQANGVKTCLGTCHETKFCVECHKGLKAAPSSHAKSDWLRKYGKDLGVHAANFKGEPSGCEICHGANEPNGSKFCKGCHTFDVPHPDAFKKNHLSVGTKSKAKCQFCHNYREVCSNCHHEGASATKPWIGVHGGVVNKAGAAGCLEKCHANGTDCVQCHTSRKVVPASHKAGKWTRDASSKTAIHAATFKQSGEACTYCHGKDMPNGSKFCKGCHKLEMPHQTGFGPPKDAEPNKDNGGQHAALFKDKKTSKTVCANCHGGSFCNSCHHKYTGAKPWVNAHPASVKAKGAAPCFNCHQETFCSYCHVRKAQQYIKK